MRAEIFHELDTHGETTSVNQGYAKPSPHARDTLYLYCLLDHVEGSGESLHGYG